MRAAALAFLLLPLLQADELADLRKSAEAGDARAQNALGIAYQWGQGIERDYAQAAKWFLAAAKQDYPPAEFNLGVMYREGQHFQPDDKTSLAWFILARDRGERAADDPIRRIYAAEGDRFQGSAYVLLGYMLLDGKLVPRDANRALEFFQLAAKDDHPDAEFALCETYLEGEFVTRDASRAEQYCRAAIQHRSTKAAAYWAVSQIEGKYLPQQKETGWKSLITLAEKQGSIDAFYSLGVLQAKGTMGKVDDVEAMKWLLVGGKFGCAACGRVYTEIASQASVKQKEEATARAQEWLKKHTVSVALRKR